MGGPGTNAVSTSVTDLLLLWCCVSLAKQFLAFGRIGGPPSSGTKTFLSLLVVEVVGNQSYKDKRHCWPDVVNFHLQNPFCEKPNIAMKQKSFYDPRDTEVGRVTRLQSRIPDNIRSFPSTGKKFFLQNIQTYFNIINSVYFSCNHLYKKLRGLSPRANYTDRAAAAGRRS